MRIIYAIMLSFIFIGCGADDAVKDATDKITEDIGNTATETQRLVTAQSLYTGSCGQTANGSSCHADSASSTGVRNLRNRSAVAIRSAINSVPAMSGIELTDNQLTEIAFALAN